MRTTAGRRIALARAAALTVGLAALALLVALWLLAISGRPVALPLAGPVALAAATAFAARFALGLAGLAAAASGERRDRLVLLALVLAALAIRLVGLDYGLVERYNPDEGIYTNRVAAINGGEVFSYNFVYPHLVFYLHAFAVWVADLFAGPLGAAAGFLWGLDGFLGRVVLRLVTALLGALTVWPAYRIGERLLDRRAALLAGLLVAFSPLHNEASHNATTDLPAAFFATLSLMYAARLLDGRATGDYLRAGLAAGLAAACKYPAGVVAVAIPFLWLRQLRRERRFHAGLLWAGLAALAAFLAAMPSLFVYPDQALHGHNNLLFAYRGYSGRAWLGVSAGHPLLFYLGLVVWSLGYPAALGGAAGLLLLDRERRARLLWLLPFPLASLYVISAVNVVVKRNLYPVFPALAVIAAVGLAAGHRRLARTTSPRLGGVVLAAVLAVPIARTSMQAVRYGSPDTRELAAAWILEHVPPGTVVAKEAYTPRLPRDLYALRQLPRYAGRVPFARLEEADLLLLSSFAHGRFFAASDREHVPAFRALYARVAASFPLLGEFAPSWRHQGPTLTLRVVRPDGLEYRRHRQFAAGEAFVSSRRMRRGAVIAVQDGQQWTAFRDFLAAGRYRACVEGRIEPPATLDLFSLDGSFRATLPLDGAATALLDLPADDKYVFHLHLGAGSVLEGMGIEPAE